MKILVTGGAGYIGSTLTPFLLAAGHNVRVLDHLAYGGQSLLGIWANPGFEFIRGDIRDREIVRAALADRDAVVHLAAIVGDPACSREPDLARSTNLDASLALIGESQTAGVKRFIFASTCSNYGKMKDPITMWTKIQSCSRYLCTPRQRWLLKQRSCRVAGATAGLRPLCGSQQSTVCRRACASTSR
jgi:nucleoside-diphosphate-sugar epimerase